MKIYYINLENSKDRRLRMETLLAEQRVADISERFAGIIADKPLRGLPLSVSGCLLSHLSLLDSLQESETAIVLEDDVSFSKKFGDHAEKIVSKFEASGMDLLFFGQTVPYRDAPTHAELIKQLSELRTRGSGAYKFLDATSFYRCGSFGYAVNGASVRKIQKLIRTFDLAENAMPIDNLQKDWLRTGRLSGAILFPYLVGVDSNIQTTMHDRANSLEHQVQADTVNLYLNGYAKNGLNNWRNILEQSPNEEALELCMIIYNRLTR